MHSKGGDYKIKIEGHSYYIRSYTVAIKLLPYIVHNSKGNKAYYILLYWSHKKETLQKCSDNIGYIV